VAAKIYADFFEHLGGGDASSEEGIPDLLSDTIKGTLRTAHTPDQTGDSVLADLPADEASATGYVAGGATLGNKTWATTSLTTTFDNTADIVWTITAGTLATDTIIFYDDSSLDPADCLISYDDFGTQSVSGADFSYVPHASGILAVTVA
jgi:hypothetical protein